ncbi:Acylphosphatase [Citrus sinensis]|uniref:Acylphosphatase n=1 Tax=Citrus sinensis TaxID=2711 RepID=A0ACB8JQU6_CITSI|nr:Acylphosphatase [Citrus sinensis]
MRCKHAINLGLSHPLLFPNNHSFNSIHSPPSCRSCFLLSDPSLCILLRLRSPFSGSLFSIIVQWEHNDSRNQITKQNNRMGTSIPQPTLRFLTSGISKRIIWNTKDAIRTHRLPLRTRSPFRSFHNPLSLLFPLPPPHSFLSPLLRPPPRFLCNMTDTQSPPAKTVRVVVKGRVQGVFYRNWTIENATQLGLRGWVRNRRDGSVEALFSGNPDSVKEMEQRCRHGPPDAVVTGLQVFPSNDDPGTGFVRKQTV